MKKKKRSARSSFRWVWLAGFIVYLAALFYVTLFAWNYGSSFGGQGPGGRNYNIEPFLSIYRIGFLSGNNADLIRILAGNIVLFLPFGFLLPGIIEGFRRHTKRFSIFAVLMWAVLTSVFIEINQFLFTYRVANVDDVILNGTGGLLGAVIYRAYRLKKPNKRKKTSKVKIT